MPDGLWAMLICCAHTSLCQKVLKLIFAKIVTYVLLSEMGSIGLVYRGLSVSLSCRTAVLYNTIFLGRRHNLCRGRKRLCIHYKSNLSTNNWNFIILYCQKLSPKQQTTRQGKIQPAKNMYAQAVIVLRAVVRYLADIERNNAHTNLHYAISDRCRCDIEMPDIGPQISDRYRIVASNIASSAVVPAGHQAMRTNYYTIAAAAAWIWK